MGKIESALKEEIARLARKTARGLQARTVEDVRKLKKRVAGLQVEIAALKRERTREQTKIRMARAAESAVTRKGVKARLSPGLIQKLRKRLRISQPELALLLDVSASAVGFWETGRVQPRPETKARIVALRSLGRRDVKGLLAEKTPKKAKKAPKKARKKTPEKTAKRTLGRKRAGKKIRRKK